LLSRRWSERPARLVEAIVGVSLPQGSWKLT
jgi:hypothetical protein